MRNSFAIILLVTAAVFLMQACNIVGPAVLLVNGPEKTPAAYRLDPERPVVFFVDDRGNRLAKRSLRVTIASTAQQILLDEREVKNVVDAKAAMTRVAGETAEEPTDIATLGKSVGAELVVYVTVDSFALSPDSVTYQPGAELRVKVIDCVNTPARLWPEESTGKLVTVSLPQRQGTQPKNAAEATIAFEELAQECGRSVAELFYNHVTQRPVRQNNSRSE